MSTINQALRLILENQVAIMKSLTGGERSYGGVLAQRYSHTELALMHPFFCDHAWSPAGMGDRQCIKCLTIEDDPNY